MSNPPIPMTNMTSPSHIVPIRSSTPTPPTILDKSALDARVHKNGTKYTFDFKHINLDRISELVRNRRHLLSHPCIEAYLSAKWMNIRKFFIANFVFFLLFLVTFTVLIWMIGNPSWNPNGKHLKYSICTVYCVAGSNAF